VAATATTRKPRLRRVDTSGPGLTRRRHGRGFVFLDEDGVRVDDDEVLHRIHELVIPPAWKDVWICPYPGGHIQATGIDQAGRKQYLYHPLWRAHRDREKFDDMLAFARALPGLREAVDADLARDDLSAEHILAVAVRLLDRGFFRIGTEDYAVQNETYGLATMHKRHCRVADGGTLLFDYPAKHGKRRVQAVVDPVVADVIATLKRRRGGGPELLACKDASRPPRWRDIRSADINQYLKDRTDLDVSAKDFRTWGATVLAAVGLAVAEPPTSKTARKRQIVRMVKEVAHYLGNTPAVARASYIDPRVIDRYDDGETIDPVLVMQQAADIEGSTAIQGPVEAAVIDLLS
jgi:DNA topoisomerase IB